MPDDFPLLIPQTVAENGSIDVDGLPDPPGPFDAAGVRADRPAPGLSHCRGSQSHRHHRRGGRARPQSRRGPPVTEHLDKLRLSSSPTEQPDKAKVPGGRAQLMQADAGICPSKPDGGLSAEKQDFPAALSPGSPPAFQAASRGLREIKRGSHRPLSNSGAPGSPHHWDAKGSRNRGGQRRGHSRGHSRGFQYREKAREEVL